MANSIEQLSASTLSSLDAMKELEKFKHSQHSQAGENAAFEKVLNQILVKELMTPMMNSSLFGKNNNYGYFLQDAMTKYLAKNLNILSPNISGKEVK